MSLLSPFLMLVSLLLLSAGFALLLYRAADEEAHEPSPADLSTSRPAPRPLWTRICACLQAITLRRTRRTSGRPREIVFEMPDSPSRTLLAGCIADL